SRFEPMKPAQPVTSQVRGWSRSVAQAESNAVMAMSRGKAPMSSSPAILSSMHLPANEASKPPDDPADKHRQQHAGDTSCQVQHHVGQAGLAILRQRLRQFGTNAQRDEQRPALPVSQVGAAKPQQQAEPGE